MCLSFILYYPRSEHSSCQSRPEYKIPDGAANVTIFDIVQNVDWTDSKAHQDFRQVVDASQHLAVCFGRNSTMKSHLEIFTPPKLDNEYRAPKCAKN
ncbi:hypothetical protein ElyMa_005459300 [Elysia marginata]|uniref:Uncharacterized protein n=1 Tax=Elysia marginata TaxID=1093978 RepID=A0AAV4EQS8_9GAST|nr:hypothetical protein ElyMa_005459300 [Elysia marginata]